MVGLVKSPDTETEKLGKDSDSIIRTSEARQTTTTTSDKEDENSRTEAPAYPIGWRLALIMSGLLLCVLCVALDITIIATAIPRITDEFQTLQDVGWYGSAYLLTTCAFQLTFGKLYSMFSVKVVYMAALLLFEVGSLVCGCAHSSATLVVGRAIAGLGSGGIFSGAACVIAHSAPIHKRAALQGSIGVVFGIASIAGPLVGGTFTDHATWRWCFWMNLPIGFVAAVILIAFLHLPPRERVRTSFFTTLQRFDIGGTLLFVPSVVCLLLALQWGGSTYTWGSGRIIALLVVFGTLFMCFVVLQIYMGEDATVPQRVASQRTIMSVSLFAFCLGGSFFMLVYLLPIWFQAILGYSAVHSGTVTIPLVLSNALACFVAGGAIMKFGPYMPWVFLCVALTSIGSGLLTTLSASTSIATIIGYQVVYGFGSGLAFQVPQLSSQVVLTPSDIPIGIAVTTFCQFLGGAIMVSAGNNVFNTNLIQQLSDLRIPDLDPVAVVHYGATQLREHILPQYLPQAINAYSIALSRAFLIAVVVACISLLGALGMEWRSVRQTISPPSETGLCGSETDLECGSSADSASKKSAESDRSS